MGHVKIDVEKNDRNYYNTSLSSEEDVYDIIFTLDDIKEDADQGNYQALAVISDFEELFLKNDVCKVYYSILVGQDGYNVEDYGKDILDLVSERLDIPKYECEEILHNSIKEMINENKEMWIKWANKNYKDQKIKVEKKHKNLLNWECKSSDECDEDCRYIHGDKNFYQRDFNRKYVVDSKMYKELGYPQDLQELVDVQKKNVDKIKELEQLKSGQKITKEQKRELQKRIKFNIDLGKDISILKRHYGIAVKNTNNIEKIEFVSYSDDDLELVEQDMSDSIIDEWQIEKIKEVASKILTDKQLIIFNLFYISELTQQQIADLIGETQGNVSRDLKVSLEKIRKNI